MLSKRHSASGKRINGQQFPCVLTPNHPLKHGICICPGIACKRKEIMKFLFLFLQLLVEDGIKTS